MKGKSEPMLTYVLSRTEDKSVQSKVSMFLNPVDLQQSFVSLLHLNGSEPTSPVLTSPVDGSGEFTLFRSRCNSGNSGTRRSRNASMHASKFATPGEKLY